MFQSRNVETVNHQSGSYRYLAHTTDRAMMERKTRLKVQELLVAEYEADGSMKFITGEDLELVSWQNQRNGTSRKWIWWSVTRSIYKVRTGEIFDELEVEKDYEKIWKCNDRVVIKNKKFIDNSVRCIKGSFIEDMQNNGRNLKTFFISGSSGLGKSKICKDLARRINIVCL